MAKTLDTETMDNIVLLREKGLTLEQAAVFCKCGHATASRVYSAYQAAMNGDYDTLRSTALMRSKNIVDWACAKFGITNLVIQNDAENAALDEAAKHEKPDNTATAFVALMESIKALTAAVDAIDKRLCAIQMTQQSFRADTAEAAKKVIEAVNINGDILTKEHERMIDLLGGIKMNTRKRGGNDQ